MIPTQNTVEDLLNLDIGKTVAQSAEKIKKKNYRTLRSFKNLLTHSMTEDLRACPRYFQLERLMASSDYWEEFENKSIVFAFGHAVGAGAAEYDLSRDLERAVWAAFLAWDADLWAEGADKQGHYDGRCFANVVMALQLYERFFYEDMDLGDYEVIGNEYTTLIDFEDGNYVICHTDTVLRNKTHGSIKIKENKTKKAGPVDAAEYSNSAQVTGYAAAASGIVGAHQEFTVIYSVYCAKDQCWVYFEFPRSTVSKLEWLQEQIMHFQTLEMYEDANFFPKNGGNCYAYFSRCQYFGQCDTPTQTWFKKDYRDLVIATKEVLMEIDPPDAIYTLHELVESARTAVTAKVT